MGKVIWAREINSEEELSELDKKINGEFEEIVEEVSKESGLIIKVFLKEIYKP